MDDTGPQRMFLHFAFLNFIKNTSISSICIGSVFLCLDIKNYRSFHNRKLKVISLTITIFTQLSRNFVKFQSVITDLNYIIRFLPQQMQEPPKKNSDPRRRKGSKPFAAPGTLFMLFPILFVKLPKPFFIFQQDIIMVQLKSLNIHNYIIKMNIVRCLILSKKNILHKTQYNFILGRLFKKKKNPQQSKHQQPIKAQQIEDEDDAIYDHFARKKQVSTNKDFRALKKNNHFIPEDIGRGGFDQIVYWAQNANNPQQILDFIKKFNKQTIPQNIEDQTNFGQFKQKVKSTVILCQNIEEIGLYVIFGYKFDILDSDYWMMIDEKIVRSNKLNEAQLKICIDIAFLMSKNKMGQYIYNHVEQNIKGREISVQDQVKLLAAFSGMKKGTKLWVDQLFDKCLKNINEFDGNLLVQVAIAFRLSKNEKQVHYNCIQKRSLELIEQLDLRQICEICLLMGSDNGSEDFWLKIEKKVISILKQRSIKKYQLVTLIHGILVNYKLSAEFIKQIIIPLINQNNLALLFGLKPNTLSALSKILYIYQFDQITPNISSFIQETIIKHYTNLDNVLTWQFIEVVKDFSITRHGSRQLYKFFEEVISALLKDQISKDFAALSALIAIYEHSGLCSTTLIKDLKYLM